MSPAKLFETLLGLYGPQDWWPAESFDELCLGAILVQNTSWGNACKALSNLAGRGLLSLPAVASASLDLLQESVYPAGTYRRKSAVIKAFAQAFAAGFGNARGFRSAPTAKARKWLLDRTGVGPETADSILCYGAGRPLLVIDAYTRRLAKRMGWLEEATLPYETIQGNLQRHLPGDPVMLGEFHALVVMHGKKFCARHPSCGICPLAKHCRFPVSPARALGD